MKMNLNGIKLPHFKEAAGYATVPLPIPPRVVLPMSQHIGAPCTPAVKPGDTVTVGQVIGEASAFVSAPIHASVSGTVKEIIRHMPLSGQVCDAVVIESDGKQTLCTDIAPPEVNDAKSLVDAVRKSGAMGLGGAGFPTHVKLAFDPAKNHVDTLLINAAECEPYITSDHRELMEGADDVIGGVQTLLRLLQIDRAVIGVEDNKPDAIELLKKKTLTMRNVEIKPLKSVYPQGAEKVLAYTALGRVIGEGELPLSQGIIVLNVSTIAFIQRYIKTGIPLVSRRLTLGGDALGDGMNVLVPIGTPVSELLRFAGPVAEPGKILMGGPMMGLCVADADTPVVKNNNAILFMRTAKAPKTTACIRCGRCIYACPMSLMPRNLESAYDARDLGELAALKVGLCINCGSCTYVCPAHRPLAEKHQLSKLLLAAKK